VKLLYFAWVRRHVGTAAETVEPPASVGTVGDLVDWLIARGGGYATAFADTAAIRAAVNQDYVPFDHPVQDGDEIAFFPPVTGG
jgi:molybdopterin synthase sulfur carrier subunit